MSKNVSKRILVADDELVTQKLVALLLRRLGFRVDTVDNGLEVLEAVRQESYDLVIIDLHMPELDGLEAVAQIRQDQAIYQPYIIAMSGQAFDQVDDWYLDVGLDDFLLKPVQEQALIQVVSQVALIPDTKSDQPELKNVATLQPEAMTMIDPAALENLQSILGSEYRMKLPWLMNRFYKNVSTLLADIRRALNEDNSAKLRRAAHTLRGACATFGAADLVELTIQLEKVDPATDKVTGIAILNQLEAVYIKVQTELESIRHTLFNQA